jgi:mono/diheme cytochrome c family protein
MRFPKVFVAATVAAPLCGALVACSTSSSAGPAAIAGASSEPRVEDPETRALLVQSCYACHSDHRTDPWYARLAPSSWFNTGRDKLNFSTWQSLPPERQKAELAAIAAVVRSGYMPLKDYAFFYPGAKLDDAQRERLAHWAETEAARGS